MGWFRNAPTIPEPEAKQVAVPSLVRRLMYCSFCGKSQDEVRQLIAGPKCFICNECVDACVDILAEIRMKQNVWSSSFDEFGPLIIVPS